MAKTLTRILGIGIAAGALALGVGAERVYAGDGASLEWRHAREFRKMPFPEAHYLADSMELEARDEDMRNLRREIREQNKKSDTMNQTRPVPTRKGMQEGIAILREAIEIEKQLKGQKQKLAELEEQLAINKLSEVYVAGTNFYVNAGNSYDQTGNIEETGKYFEKAVEKLRRGEIMTEVYKEEGILGNYWYQQSVDSFSALRQCLKDLRENVSNAEEQKRKASNNK